MMKKDLEGHLRVCPHIACQYPSKGNVQLEIFLNGKHQTIVDPFV